jgi:NarL family two-component system response regulator LiaR
MSIIAVALVDDHRVVTRSLQAYLESFPELRVVHVAATGEEFLARLPDLRVDVVLQDLLLPGGIDGIETIRRALARSPDLRIVALTASMDEARMTGALRAGALGYVRKDAEPETLLAAVRTVARGRPYIDPGATRQILSPGATIEELTSRELEVLRELARGRSNRDIAAALNLGQETVKTHVTRVLAKLQADNRAHAIVQALRGGVLTVGDLD